MQMPARHVSIVTPTPPRFLYFDRSGVGCHGRVDEDVVVDDAEPGGEDVVEADDDETDEVVDEEHPDWIFETEGAYYCVDNQRGQHEETEVDNLEDDVGTEEARLRLADPESHHEDVEERRGPLEDSQDGLGDGQGGGERSEASQADGGFQAGHDVAASLDLLLHAKYVLLSDLHQQPGGEDKHSQIFQDQKEGEGKSTEREMAVLALGGSEVVVDDVNPAQDEEDASERSTQAKELSRSAQRKSESEERHFLILLSLSHLPVEGQQYSDELDSEVKTED